MTQHDPRFDDPPPKHHVMWPTVPDAPEGAFAVTRVRHDYLEPLHEPTYGVAMPAVMEAADGTVIATWYGGTVSVGKSWDPHERDGAAYYSVLDKASGQWSAKRVLDQEPDNAHASAFLFKNARGRVFAGYTLFDDDFNYNYGHSRLRVRSTDDGGTTWSPARDLPGGRDMRAATNGVLLADGTILLGVTLENTPGRPDFHFGACATLASRDGGENWDMSDLVLAPDGTYLREPSLVAEAEGSVRMFMRSSLPGAEWSGGSPENPVYLWEARSRDGGRTWTDVRPTSVINNESTIDVVRLAGGALLLAHNDTPYCDWQKRWPLDLAVSNDGGETWHKIARVDPGPGYVCHPSLDVSADGSVHVVYTCVYRTVRYVNYRLEER